LLITASVYFYTQNRTPQLAYEQQQIENVGSNAFGSLADVQTESMTTEGRGSASFGVDGGGQLNIAEDSSASGDDNASSQVIRPNLINYDFQYKGEAIDVQNINNRVYKRVKQGLASSDFSRNILSQLNTGLLDASKLNQAVVNNIEIRQNREFGHAIYMNLEQGVVGINKNWEQWPNSKIDCRDDACFKQQQLQPDDVPQDNEIINIAKEFINKYGIDTSSYGEPTVMHHWRKTAELASDSSSVHVPEEIPVVFPLVIGEEKVYEQAGSPYGLILEVNIKHKRVAGARNLAAQKFQSSSYEAVNEPQKITDMAERGGLQAPYEHDAPTKTVTIELGTPEVGLISIMKRDDQGSQQLFTPAFIFPIIDRSEQTYFTRDHIVVPATKELFEQEWERMNSSGPAKPGMPEIMPQPRN
jgi:hypothetical protein